MGDIARLIGRGLPGVPKRQMCFSVLFAGRDLVNSSSVTSVKTR